jgi:hypothetical protein
MMLCLLCCSPQRMSCRKAVSGSGSCRSTSCGCSALCRNSTFPTGTRTRLSPVVQRVSCSNGAVTAAKAGLASAPRPRLSPASGLRNPQQPEAPQVSCVQSVKACVARDRLCRPNERRLTVALACTDICTEIIGSGIFQSHFRF